MLLRIDARNGLGWIEQSRSNRIGGPDRRIEGLAGEEIVDELEIGFGVVRIDILPAIISADDHLELPEIQIDPKILIELFGLGPEIILANRVDADAALGVRVVQALVLGGYRIGGG